MPIIIIDPGHGGAEVRGRSTPRGASGSAGTVEKDVTLEIALALTRELGEDAATTRSEDRNLSLAERASVARRQGAEVFLSLHANDGAAGERGPETWVHTRAGGASRALALEIQKELAALGGGDRGVLAGNLAVLTPQRLPPRAAACLVEVDFLSDPKGESRLQGGDPIVRIAQALARAVRRHGAGAGSAFGAPFGLYERYASSVTPAVRAQDSLRAPTYNPSTPAQSIRMILDWVTRRVTFVAGVPNTSFFPHSSICHLQMRFPGDPNEYQGTGFYIGPDRILTAGHNAWDTALGVQASRIEVLPGKNRDTPSSTFVARPGEWEVHPSYRTGPRAGDPAFDMAVIRARSRVPAGEAFGLEELTFNPVTGVVVCGYGLGTDPDTGQSVDPDVQHMDVNTIREVFDGTFTYAIETRGGNSGSPVFYVTPDGHIRAVGIHVASRFAAGDLRHQLDPRDINVGNRLTAQKIRWIRGV